MRAFLLAIEKAFFATLTRKLAGCFAFVLLVQLGLWAACRSTLGAVRDALSGAPAAAQAAADAAAATGLWWMVAIQILVVFSTLAMIAYLRFLIVRPVREVSRLFARSVQAVPICPETSSRSPSTRSGICRRTSIAS